MMNLCTAQWWWLRPITAVVGWFGGYALVLGVFVLRELARRPTKPTAPADKAEKLSLSAQGPQPFPLS